MSCLCYALVGSHTHSACALVGIKSACDYLLTLREEGTASQSNISVQPHGVAAGDSSNGHASAPAGKSREGRRGG